MHSFGKADCTPTLRAWLSGQRLRACSCVDLLIRRDDDCAGGKDASLAAYGLEAMPLRHLLWRFRPGRLFTSGRSWLAVTPSHRENREVELSRDSGDHEVPHTQSTSGMSCKQAGSKVEEQAQSSPCQDERTFINELDDGTHTR